MSIGAGFYDMIWPEIDMPLPSHSREQRPVYREVLSAAFRTAWHERRYWPLALFASALLSAGTYDVLLRGVDGMTRFSGFIGAGSARVSISSHMMDVWTGRADIVDAILNLQAVFAFLIIILIVLGLSCVAQGGLVYALGAVKRGQRPTLKEAFQVGGGAFWPIALLNALVLSSIWLVRVLMASLLILSIQQQTAVNWFLYLIGFLLFASLTFSIAVIHVFALNAMMLQGASVSDAITRGYVVFKENWVVAVETALALLFVAAVVGAGYFILLFIGLVPFLAALAISVAVGFAALYDGALLIGCLLFLASILAVAAFLTQLQYAAWTHLYRRMGEGGVVPKISRIFRRR